MIEVVAGKPFMGGAGIDSFWNPPSSPRRPAPCRRTSSASSAPCYRAGHVPAVGLRPEQLHQRAGSTTGSRTASASAPASTVNVTIAGRRGTRASRRSTAPRTAPTSRPSATSCCRRPTPARSPPRIRATTSPTASTSTCTSRRRVPTRAADCSATSASRTATRTRCAGRFLVGLGGTGLVPGRSRDTWGVGYYYDGLSDYVKDTLAPTVSAGRAGPRDLLRPRAHALVRARRRSPGDQARPGDDTAVVPGVRAVIRF